MIEAESGPAVGRSHVCEPSREHFPVQVVVDGGHLLYRAINTAPVDGIRHKEVRNPTQVHMGWHSDILQAAELSLSSCTRTSPSAGLVKCAL